MPSDLAYCDFLVLAPLDLEIRALTAALRKAGWTLSPIDTVDFPSAWNASLRDASVYHFTRRVVVLQLNHQGVLNASVDTAKALEIYEPGYVVSYGLAGSFTKDDAPIGSVVVATTLTYYEPSKDKGGRTESRMAPIPVGDSLLNPFRQITLKHLQTTDGPIASGEKLFADLQSHDRRRITGANSKTLVVEMEAAGVARCAHQLCPSSEVLVLKGVSDLADKKKNRLLPSVQKKNRARAAANASACLAQLMTRGPLRRAFRSLPRPADTSLPRKADEEAEQILSILAPYGIKVGFSEMYACLHARRGPIPAYYHWCQHGPELHWIDFKILTALRALPRNVISPTPLVTPLGDQVHAAQPWYATVRRLLGVEPVTEIEIRSQQNQIASYFTHAGFTPSVEEEIRAALDQLGSASPPAIALNLMRYMLGQLAHRRMFVFTWKSKRAKWEHLSRAFDTRFALFCWDTMLLDGKNGKQEEPGKSLTVEPSSYEAISRWIATAPASATLAEFLEHFRCHNAAGVKTRRQI